MYRIILVTLLLWNLHSQTVEVVDRASLPSEPASIGYIMNPNR